MNRFYAISAVAVLLVVGCAAPNEPLRESAPSSSPAFTTADTGPANKPPDDPESTQPPDDPGVAKIGATQWFTYPDGLRIQATKAVRSGAAVVVTITIRNGAKKTVDLASTSVDLTYGANGITAEQDYSANSGFGYPGFTGTVTPGRAKTARYAFIVPKNQTLDVEVAPGFLDYESVHFEGHAN